LNDVTLDRESGKIDIICKGDMISIFQGDTILFNSFRIHRGVEILFHNAPFENGIQTTPSLELNRAQKRAIFTIKTQLSSLQLLRKEIETVSDLETKRVSLEQTMELMRLLPIISCSTANDQHCQTIATNGSQRD
jgi:hypothetical protein